MNDYSEMSVPTSPMQDGSLVEHVQEEDVPDIQQLPNLLRALMILDNEVKTLNSALKERKKKYDLMKKMVMKAMKGNKLGQVNTQKGTIQYKSSSTKESLSRKFLLVAFSDFFKGDATKAQELYDFMESKRGKKLKEELKINTRDITDNGSQ